MIVGGYSLDLYCENLAIKPGEIEDDFGHRYDDRHQFYGATEADANREARAAGWRLHLKAGRAYCRRCVKAGRATPQDAAHRGEKTP